MEKKYVLAIDQSTQGTKAILFDKNGDLFCRADLPHAQLVNDLGWVSHDLEEIYANTVQVVKNLVEKAGIAKEEIACLGISNQRETSAAWDRNTGKPLADAIVWQCARAESVCERIRKQGGSASAADQKEEKGIAKDGLDITKDGIEAAKDGLDIAGSGLDIAEEIRHRTGMQLSPYFPASKYAWLQENVEAVAKAKKAGSLCLGTIDSWLLFRLTGGAVYATEYSNASRTQLFNIHTLQWDREICGWFGIDADQLPVVMDSNAQFGVTDFERYLEEPIPICGCIGDSQGALFGQGGTKRGMVKATYGTGSSVMMNAGDKPLLSDDGVVTSLAWGLDGKVTYVLEGNINYSGAVITWLKDDVGLITSAGETEALAREANPKDETYLVPAFSGLGAPYWKSDARAVLCGMSRTTGKKEIVKAALESIAYQITDILEVMKKADQIEIQGLCVDGGPTKNRYLMQFQSDILRAPLFMPKCEETSALGAGMIAGLSSGFYGNEAVLPLESREHVLPAMDIQERNHRYDGWKQALHRTI